MTTGPAPDDAIRHRLLEGILLRLARRPDAGAFVLRGGALLRHWLRPVPRPAEDLDLVATGPFDSREVARRFLPLLADPADDGVAFDAAGVRAVDIFLDTGARSTRKRSNRSSQAVIVVSGKAAASEKPIVLGLRLASRSSTHWNCA
jgi:hypothetical protein